LKQLRRCLCFYENEDDFKEIEKGKLKRENVGMPLVSIYRKEQLAIQY